jgi:hypothetical protein
VRISDRVKLPAEAMRGGLLGDRAGANGKFLGLGALGTPIVGRKRNTPKARGWLIKLDADRAFVILAFADDHDGASNFFAGFHISDTQAIAVRNHLLHQNKRAMGIDDLSYSFLGKRKTGNLFTRYDDVNSEEQSLAAACGGGFGGFYWEKLHDGHSFKKNIGGKEKL